MIAIALLLAGSPVPQSLLDAADAAGLAQTQCAFATFRAANQARLPPSGFAANLRSRCAAQSQEVRRLSGRIFSIRGESNPAARADQMIEDSYRTMVEEYRRFPEKEKMIRDFCKSDPSDCR